MGEFEILPAIDLRSGSVVRLKQGDPDRQTVYDRNPASVACRFLESGVRWLHVVNLDGAFGQSDAANRQALETILEAAGGFNASVQFGGGLRNLDDIRTVLDLGVARVVVGTLVVEQPEKLSEAVEEFGPERVAAAIDSREGLVSIRGWAQVTSIPAVELAQRMAAHGLNWLIFTDVIRDGLRQGLNVQAAKYIAEISGLNVVASGGLKNMEDLERARQAGLAGAIIGRALYEGEIDLDGWLQREQDR